MIRRQDVRVQVLLVAHLAPNLSDVKGVLEIHRMTPRKTPREGASRIVVRGKANPSMKKKVQPEQITLVSECKLIR